MQTLQPKYIKYMNEEDKKFEDILSRALMFTTDEELEFDENFKHNLKSSFFSLQATDQAEMISSIKGKKRPKFISFISNDIDAEVLLHLDKAILLDFVDIIGSETLGKMLSVLSVNMIVDVLSEFSKEFRKEALEFVGYKKRLKVKKLFAYPEGSVGRYMSFEYLSIPSSFLVKDVIEYLRKNTKADMRNIKNAEIFVLSPENKIIGSISILDVLKLQHQDVITHIIRPYLYILNTYDDITEAIEYFIEYHMQIIPVVDSSNEIIGALEINNITSLIKDEAEKNLFAPAGVFEAKKEGVFGVAKARFAWLFINFITASSAASVISSFEPLISTFAVLASLTPIVASVGGNTGNQTSAVIIRSLAVREFEISQIVREMLTCFLNAVLFGLMAFIVSYAIYKNFLLSLSFGLAIFINLNLGGVVGSVIPFTLYKLKIDPALCSSIFVTMMTDMAGFFSFLGIAYLLLS